MTRKHARSKFYSALRSIASNYQWTVIDGAIRGRFKNPRDQKATPFWPLFCPLTATHNGNKMNERVKLSQYTVAGELLGLTREDIELIGYSADYPGHSMGNRDVRKTLLRCVGLA